MPGRENSLRGRALALLARREHTRTELRRKLGLYAESEDEINRLLDELEQRGWLSEARYAESRVNMLGRKFGSRKIAYDLKSRGLSADLIERALQQARSEELENCRAAWLKKFGVLPANVTERNRQQRFLAGRGFSGEVVRAVLKSGDVD